MPALTDYFAPGPAIMARLKPLSGLMAVEELGVLADCLAGSPEEAARRLATLAPRCPAVFVGFDRELPAPAYESGDQVVQQRWLVVLAVRHAGGATTGREVQTAAGPILPRLIKSLSGWRPLPEVGPLFRIAAPAPAIVGGFGFFALAFSLTALFEGADFEEY
ncbi:MAG: hypothetical protein Q8O33_04475 [Pseudomonadota bacterium]|nr:hypothetical protein [Pseudomonadota bacterium]